MKHLHPPFEGVLTFKLKLVWCPVPVPVPVHWTITERPGQIFSFFFFLSSETNQEGRGFHAMKEVF